MTDCKGQTTCGCEGLVKALESVKRGIDAMSHQDFPSKELLGNHSHDIDKALTAHRAHQCKKSSATNELSGWMIKNSFATGHGDTTTDMLNELQWQIDELRKSSAESGVVEITAEQFAEKCTEDDSPERKRWSFAAAESYAEWIKETWPDKALKITDPKRAEE